jgi:hypothetical protein
MYQYREVLLPIAFFILIVLIVVLGRPRPRDDD